MAQLRYRYEETRSDLSHVRDRTTTLRGFYGFNWQRQQISSGMIMRSGRSSTIQVRIEPAIGPSVG